MKILGIETSCDETAAAIVENGTKILSNVVASSSEMHSKTGGVVPEAAARQQVVSILPVIETAFSKAKLVPNDIDAIAVTVGPGLVGSLLVGIETARTFSLLWKKPLIPVNHLVAHIYANWLSISQPKLPALSLVVSGGHTDLVLMKDHGNLEWIGGTRDDAAGECFDKCARLLGLPYPGGPSISAEASKFQPRSGLFVKNGELKMFPRPMIDDDSFDWSFSGLKTAVLRTVENPKSTIVIPMLAAEIQEAIVDVLVEKTLRAVKKFKPGSLLLAGGVAANSRLREKFEKEIKNLELKIDFRVPPPKLCTDNAAYIAAYAYFVDSTSGWTSIDAKPELTIVGQI
ncbi:tRNA (adenosine(37)-N6)-threonylcarbamoyltransferase complex transferase subunit TsaD [Candidatus Woesebacteria bacterium]|nr:tRNA (adenosine(37)-N6)-threonylcarbamoyltransferase complex transferase subunit TsaD [Candidatus Woesebacteria bacterium]